MKMKTKSNLLNAVITLATIMGFFTFAIGTTRADSGVIYVEPSGDPTGVTDTNNIEYALNNYNTVILSEGVFYLGHPILVADFDGTFKGQGKGKTIITNFFDDEHPFPVEDFHPYRTYPYTNDPLLLSTFFTFYLINKITAYIEIADMTIKPTGYSVRPNGRFYPIIIETPQNFPHPFPYPYNGYYNTKLTGIEILGQLGPNIQNGITFWHGSGDFYMSNCYISNAFSGCLLWMIENSNIEISKNEFVDCVCACNLHPIDYCFLKFSRNIVLNSGGLVFSNLEIGKSNSFLIKRNDIFLPVDHDFAGVEIYDWGPSYSNIVITNNKIHSENSMIFGPILIFGAKDTVITNNIITGSGPAAMYFGLLIGKPTSGLMIKGNNLENWQVADYNGMQGWFPGVAPIWLGWATSNCILVGNTRSNVADDGTNNILVGMTKIQGPAIGQEIRDAMEQKRQLLEQFWDF
jgi:hypothetical protein